MRHAPHVSKAGHLTSEAIALGLQQSVHPGLALVSSCVFLGLSSRPPTYSRSISCPQLRSHRKPRRREHLRSRHNDDKACVWLHPAGPVPKLSMLVGSSPANHAALHTHVEDLGRHCRERGLLAARDAVLGAVAATLTRSLQMQRSCVARTRPKSWRAPGEAQRS